MRIFAVQLAEDAGEYTQYFYDRRCPKCSCYLYIMPQYPGFQRGLKGSNTKTLNTMTNTDHYICRALMDLLFQWGITDIVVCPGTRNAPLVQAAAASELTLHHVIDERVAAFVALGMAVEQGRPTAVACTSGSAVLNMAPACAEAFYRQVPLIVISADRPRQWIGQADGQTIRQAGALDAVVRASRDIPVLHNDQETRAAIRVINETLCIAKGDEIRGQGPVHLNIQIDSPLGKTVDIADEDHAPVIRSMGRCSGFSLAPHESETLRKARVLFLAGPMPPCDTVRNALSQLAALPNVAVATDILSNIRDCGFNIDTVLNALTPEQRRTLLPDIVITSGGGITSALAKDWLRDGAAHKITQHLHIGTEGPAVDTFLCQTASIQATPQLALPELAAAISADAIDNGYAALWRETVAKAREANRIFCDALPWCELTAIRHIIESMPDDWGLHLSNGTTVRYAQTAGCTHLRRVDANRGVNGIDGSTSTAIGASMGSRHTTLLLTGDMSAQYDFGALLVEDIPATFKMVVINNSGGGIFRAIANTRHLPAMPQYLAGGVILPLEAVCNSRGFGYYRADSLDALESEFEAMAARTDSPCILEVVVPPETGVKVFKRLYILYKNSI